MKKCPFCAEEIQDEAIKCKYCGEILESVSRSDMGISTKKRKQSNWVWWGIAFVVVVSVVTKEEKTLLKLENNETPKLQSLENKDQVTQDPYVRAQSLIDKGKFEEASADLNTAIERNPQNAEAYNLIGLVYLQTDNCEKALIDYSKAIEINPKFSKSYGGRGTAYLSLGKFDLAIADFSKVIEINQAPAEGYAARGMAYYWKGSDEQALADFTQAINIQPKSPLALYTRGLIYNRQGKYGQGLEDITLAKKLGFNANPNEESKYKISNYPYVRKRCSGWNV